MNDATFDDADTRLGESYEDAVTRHSIEFAMLNLVRRAQDEGYNVEIRTESVPPLAMRNHRPVIYFWKAR